MKKQLAAGLLLISGASAFAANDIVLVSNGPGGSNLYPEEQWPAELLEWCNENPCSPTVQLILTDAKTGVPKGTLYAWGVLPPVFSSDGTTFCFQEFVIWDFRPGQVYTATRPNGGACGATLSDELVEPKSGVSVIAGGGEGDIVGGTGAFSNWSGTYVTRVFVETDANGNFSYYDYLFAKLSGSNAPTR
jgi:hypothetical protein